MQIIIFHISSRSALRAMTGSEGESAVISFGIVTQLLKHCGAIRIFDYRFTLVLRRIGHLLSHRFSDCAAEYKVNRLFYNTLTPTE